MIKITLSKFTTLDAWYKDDVMIDFGADSTVRLRPDATLQFTPLKKSHEGSYHFTASNKYGNATSDKTVLTVVGE